MNKITCFACVITAALLTSVVPAALGQIDVSSPTTYWTPVYYANPDLADPPDDHQAKGTLEGDIVGNAGHSSFYTAFWDGDTPEITTDGQLAFRLRVAGVSNQNNGFRSNFFVGMDINGDGALDIFAGALSHGGTDIGIYPGGPDLNISPNTTDIASNAPFYETAWTTENFNFQPVTSVTDPTATNFNLDGGSSGGQTDDTDHFVSFVIPFNELVTAVNSLELEGIDNFDENSVIRYVTATAQQRNALNQDLNGVEGSTGSSSTWEELGGFTPEVYASGQPIPEPTSALLLGAGCMLLFSRGRRRAHA